MIILDDATTKLQLTTSAAQTVHVVVSYRDVADAAHRESYRSQETAITTATTTDILAVPATGRQREVLQIVISSTTGTSVCTLKKDVNGTDYQIGGAVSLAVGEWLTVDVTGRFAVYSATGKRKETGGGGGGLSDGDYGDVAVSGVGTVMTVEAVPVVDAADDTSTWVLLARNQTGAQSPTTDSSLVYNASSGTLQATTFSGALSGAATSAAALSGTGNWKVWHSEGTGNSVELALGAADTFLKSNGAAAAPTFSTVANITGNAATVTVADAAGDTTTFPMLATDATGSLAPATDAGLTYNANTNALTTTTFIGALSGNATTSSSTTGNAATVTVADAAGDTTTWPMLATDLTGSLAPATDAGLSYNANTNALTATTFVGALSGNATTSSSTTGNAATVTVADAGEDTTTWPMLATSQTGSLAPATDAGLTYQGTTNALTATTFIGALSGNASTATTATNVTTNANLTGHVTSVGNAAVLGSFTVAQLNTAISDGDVATGGGTATGTNTGDQTITLTGGVTGSGTGSFAATVVTNANLTGHVTSVGNAAVLGVFTQVQLNAAISDTKLWITKHKVTTETVTDVSFGSRANSTTLGNDTDLIVALAASTKYSIRAVVFFNTANANMDFKFATAYSGTTTGTAQSFFRGLPAGAATGTSAESQGQTAGQVASTALTAATSGVGHIGIEQTIEANGAGNWSIQWAQNTSDGGNCSVMFGSYIEYRVIA